MKMLRNDVNIGIIGLGYVGLPLAVEFSKFFNTVGFDKNKTRINELKNSIDKTKEVGSKQLSESKLKFTEKLTDVSDCNIYIITVPTPVDEFKKPDLRPLASASKAIAKLINKKDIIIYESTVYPGATEEYCIPLLEEFSKLTFNKDFFCGYSPERINPGDKDHTLKSIIKITSGSNDEIATFIDNLYSVIISAGTYKAPSIAIAEAAKVIENTQRDVNIALMNELAIIFDKLDLDTLEVLKAAGTKWNFLPFRPGLVGGHCIGVDPYYLTHKSMEVGYSPEIILAGRRINDNVGKFIVEKLILNLAKNGKNIKNTIIGIFGLTFKENCPDFRNSKVLEIIEHLKSYNCRIIVTDNWVNKNDVKSLYDIDLADLNSIKNIDAAILAVSHDEYRSISVSDWEKIILKDGSLLDVKSLYELDKFNESNINYWRL